MTSTTPVIDQLYQNLARLAASEKNQRRTTAAPHPQIILYLENIAWAAYLAYDMNRFLADPLLQTEMLLRQNTLQFEFFDDDTVLAPDLGATVGIIWEMTLFGLRLRHTTDGVPHVLPDHPLRRDPDIAHLRPHDFTTTGDMPALLRMYEQMREIAAGRWNVSFPTWHRGPLDIAIALRGYEAFLSDTAERPRFVHHLMSFIVEERIRWWDEYCRRFDLQDRATGISDDWMNVPALNPSIFRDFVLPYHLQLERYHGAIPWVHSCGDYVPLMPYLLEMKSLDTLEINSWMSFEHALQAIPTDKTVCLIPKPTDVLTFTEDQAERDLRSNVHRLRGREFSILVGGLSRIHHTWDEDIHRIQRWIAAAKRATGRTEPGEP